MPDIQLPQPKEPDIFTFGFDKGLKRPIEITSNGLFYGNISKAINTSQILSGGSLDLKTLNIGGLIKQVAPDEDIQKAINDIADEGGGTVQLLAGAYKLFNNIEIKSGVSLIGAGRDLTVLDFHGDAFGIVAKGTSGSVKKNMKLANFTLQNSNNVGGIDIDFFDFWIMENVRVTSCDQKGIKVDHSRDFILTNCRLDNNTGNGIDFVGDATRSTDDFNVITCISDNNGGIGFSFSATGATLRRYHIFGCRAEDNTGDGFDIDSGTQCSFVSCNSISNSGIGFDIDVNDTDFLGCNASSNTGDGFELTAGTAVRIMACSATVNTGLDYDFAAATGGTFVGNFLPFASNEVPSDVFTETDTPMNIISNEHGGTRVERRVYSMKNTSGGGLREGDVVAFKAVASGEEVTTTTTQGDDLIFGMSIATIADDRTGLFLTIGHTTKLHVSNVTASIVIGDFLGSYTHSYFARQAVSGDMAFAIALENAVGSTSQINALLITPRKI